MNISTNRTLQAAITRRRVLLEAGILTALTAAALGGVFGSGSGYDHGLIIGLTLLAAKVLGKKSDDADENAQGTHPVTRFVFKVANTGDFDDIDDMLDDEFRAYANGHPIVAVGAEHGPELMRAIFGAWREAAPDVRWELYDESAQKQKDKTEVVALRLVSTATIDGEVRETEIATFIRVKDSRMIETRLVTDLTDLNEQREAAGLPAFR